MCAYVRMCWHKMTVMTRDQTFSNQRASGALSFPSREQWQHMMDLGLSFFVLRPTSNPVIASHYDPSTAVPTYYCWVLGIRNSNWRMQTPDSGNNNWPMQGLRGWWPYMMAAYVYDDKIHERPTRRSGFSASSIEEIDLLNRNISIFLSGWVKPCSSWFYLFYFRFAFIDEAITVLHVSGVSPQPHDDHLQHPSAARRVVNLLSLQNRDLFCGILLLEDGWEVAWFPDGSAPCHLILNTPTMSMSMPLKFSVLVLSIVRSYIFIFQSPFRLKLTSTLNWEVVSAASAFP
jgi:hypothetical protein